MVSKVHALERHLIRCTASYAFAKTMNKARYWLEVNLRWNLWNMHPIGRYHLHMILDALVCKLKPQDNFFTISKPFPHSSSIITKVLSITIKLFILFYHNFEKEDVHTREIQNKNKSPFIRCKLTISIQYYYCQQR